MPLPNFLGIGAQKAGTTTLSNIFKEHPDISYLINEYFRKDIQQLSATTGLDFSDWLNHKS